MTVSVRVQARAWGAKVQVQHAGKPDETLELTANTEHVVHLEVGDSVTVSEEEPDEVKAAKAGQLNPMPFQGEPVPGRAENDKLLGKSESSVGKEPKEA